MCPSGWALGLRMLRLAAGRLWRLASHQVVFREVAAAASAVLVVDRPTLPPGPLLPLIARAAMATETYALPENWSEDLKDENGQPMSKR